MRPSTTSAFCTATSLNIPRWCNPAPSLGAAFISSTTRMTPVGETSAMVCRIEFEPMSIADTRTLASGRVAVPPSLIVKTGFVAIGLKLVGGHQKTTTKDNNTKGRQRAEKLRTEFAAYERGFERIALRMPNTNAAELTSEHPLHSAHL